MSAPQRDDRTRLDGFELEIFKLVRKGATSEQWREWLLVPLEHAAADGNMDLFTRLMDAGADGSAGWRGCHGRTLLGAAAAGKNEEMVLALLRAGAKDDVDVKFGAQRESALYVAAAHGAEAASRALMFAGADPNVVDRAKRSPLHVAAQEGHDVIVRDLLMVGVDSNAKDAAENTPLHLAAKEGRVLCVSNLLLGGAEKNSRNDDGDTPLYLAAENDQLGVVEELLATEADPDIRANNTCRPLDIAANCCHLDVLRALLRHGGDIKACYDDGYTALHYATDIDEPGHDNGGAVRVLLEPGADVEAKTTEFGCTSLHAASSRRVSSRGTMKALLEGGANVNARSTSERTPLHSACNRSSVGVVSSFCCVGEQTRRSWMKVEIRRKASWGCGNKTTAATTQNARPITSAFATYMLARAPADRSWRRRGWLVLARSRPARVQLANDSRSSNSGSSVKVAKARGDGLGAGEGRDGDLAMVDLGSLVRRMVGLDAEGVFRLVIGFL